MTVKVAVENEEKADKNKSNTMIKPGGDIVGGTHMINKMSGMAKNIQSRKCQNGVAKD